jgi:anti-anti-sigma factor
MTEGFHAAQTGTSTRVAERGPCGIVVHHEVMKVREEGSTLCISDLEQLGAAEVKGFQGLVLDALNDSHRSIEIDLSGTRFIDSSGLGALLGLRKFILKRQGTLRLRSPTAPVLQILQLTRLDQVFDLKQVDVRQV